MLAEDTSKISDTTTTGIDLITFEVIRSGFVAACFEASTTIERIAYHPIVGMGRDRSNSFLTPEGDLVAHGHTDPSAHYGSFEESVKELLKDHPANTMEPKTVFLFSDPYRTGSHVNDTRMIRPIFYKDELVAFGVTVIHWPDIGGPQPGTFNPMADSCYAEGLRIPPVKLYVNDEMDMQIWSLIAINIRASVERMGDVTAQFEGGRLLEKRMVEFCDKYGVDTVRAAMQEQFAHSERLLRAEITDVPDGSYYMEDYGDMDVLAPGQPPIKVACTLTIKGDQITFDWSESDPQPVASWGGARATLLGANYLGFMICFPHLFPMNHGITRSIEIISKKGTCVDVEFPCPTTGYCSGAFDKVEAVSIGCLAKALASVRPWRVYAAAVSLTNLCLGGIHPKTRRQFVQYTNAVGGENARSFKDGKELIFMRFCNARTIPQELEERWFPMIYTRYQAIQDSCGHGKFRGGFGLMRELLMTGDQTMTIHGDREKFPPWGVCGGLNAGGSGLKINVGTPEENDLGVYATGVRLKTGDKVYYRSAGGGGFGSPLERDPELVRKDVRDGWVSIGVAKDVYAVVVNVINEDAALYEVDEEATAKLRAEMLAEGEAHFKVGLSTGEVNPLTKDIKLGWWPTEEEVAPHITYERPPGW